MKAKTRTSLTFVVVVTLSAIVGVSLGHGLAVAAGKKKGKKARLSAVSARTFKAGTGEKIYGVGFDPRGRFHHLFMIQNPNFGAPGQLGFVAEHYVRNPNPPGTPYIPDVINYVVSITITNHSPETGAGDTVFVKDDIIGKGQDIAGEEKWMQSWRGLYNLKPGMYWVQATWYDLERRPGEKVYLGQAGHEFLVK